MVIHLVLHVLVNVLSINAVQTQVTTNAQGVITKGYPERVTLQKGLVVNFTGLDNNNFVFSIGQDVIQTVDSGTGIATFSNIELFEGNFLTDTFVRDTSERQRFILQMRMQIRLLYEF